MVAVGMFEMFATNGVAVAGRCLNRFLEAARFILT